MSNQNITRAEIEKALAETAWAFFLKGDRLQYDSQELTLIGGTTGGGNTPLRKFWGGALRTSLAVAPEEATSDSTLFTVCSDYAWKTYFSTLGYPLLGFPLNALTQGIWSYTEHPQDMVVLRWLEDPEKTCANICGLPESVISEKHRVDLPTMQDFIRNWDKNLRPGDILITYEHTMMYIGGGFVVDAWGYKYDMNTGIDRFERKGTVCTLHQIEDIYLTGHDPVTGVTYHLGNSEIVKFFAIIRPLNVLTKDAGTGNPGDDILDTEYVLPKYPLRRPENLQESGYTITPATYSRLQYPGLCIDRTVDITPYGTAEKDGTLTYSVTLSNRSDNPLYDTYWSAIYGKPYYGQDHTGIVVTEKVPAGTELVHASGNATVNGDTISWKVDVPAGGTLRVYYTVRVTAEAGSTIVSKDGFVADIPSISITNVVGGKKLSKPAAAGIRNFYFIGEKRAEKFDVHPTSEPTEYANAIYEKTAGLALNLPSTQELLDNLFDHTQLQMPYGWFTRFNTPWSTWMYTLKEQTAPEYQALRDMIVRGYIGGLYVYTNRETEPRINEFSLRYMEPGDVVVGAKLSPDTGDGAKRTVTSSRVIVCLGNDQYLCANSDGTVTQHETVDILWTSFIDDVFFCLRPRQGYKDINENKA